MATIKITNSGSKTVWRGSRELVRKRAKWHVNNQTAECALRYEGPYEIMLANSPNIGDVAKSYEKYGVKVADFTIEPGEGGGAGIMDVLLQNPNLPETQTTFGQVGDPVPQLIWQPFQRLIERHPRCGRAKDYKLKSGERIPDDKYQAVPDGWTLAQYKLLCELGVTSYDAAQPVLSLTTFHYSKPNNVGQNNFLLDTPPATLPIPLPPPGSPPFSWLRGGDDLSRQDRLWRLLQVWTGFIVRSNSNEMALLYGGNS